MRKKSLRTFARKSDSLHVIVATSAFGLGVNLKSICVGAPLSLNASVSFTCTPSVLSKPTSRKSAVTAGMSPARSACPFSPSRTSRSCTPPASPPT